MRWHVNNMSRNWHGCLQPISRGQRTFRCQRRFHQVYVQMQNPRVCHVSFHNMFKRQGYLQGFIQWFTFNVPVVPTCDGHIGCGIKCSNIGILRVLTVYFAHRRQVGAISVIVIGNTFFVIQHEERVDQLRFQRVGTPNKVLRLGDCFKTFTLWVIRHAGISAIRIWAHGMRHTPIGHWVRRVC